MEGNESTAPRTDICSFMAPDWTWYMLHEPFSKLGDTFLVVAPSRNSLYVADAEAISQITSRRNDFPKPTELYKAVDIYGKNVVSTEGSVWRHHRKITSAPFTEKNNLLVWKESLHQAQSMVQGWMGSGDGVSALVQHVAEDTMRFSLHVISRAGFGVRLSWPHEPEQSKPGKGHTMSYKDALGTLLENLPWVMLVPKHILGKSYLLSETSNGFLKKLFWHFFWYKKLTFCRMDTFKIGEDCAEVVHRMG